MRVLVTGSGGHIGSETVRHLTERGETVRAFDRTAVPRDSVIEYACGDLRDLFSLRRAVEGMEAIVHLAALSHDGAGTPEDLLDINVRGTLHVLLAAEEAGIRRVVCFSSVNSLGNFGGHRKSEYLPIDDQYPKHPITPYQLSKHLVEESCRSFTARTGMTTICLRPMYVARPRSYERLARKRDFETAVGMGGDYWAYVDLRDVNEAVYLALHAEGIDYDAFLLAAPDTVSHYPTADLVEAAYPDTPWPRISRGDYLSEHPFRSLIDCSHAAARLGWRPQHSWRHHGSRE